MSDVEGEELEMHTVAKAAESDDEAGEPGDSDGEGAINAAGDKSEATFEMGNSQEDEDEEKQVKVEIAEEEKEDKKEENVTADDSDEEANELDVAGSGGDVDGDESGDDGSCFSSFLSSFFLSIFD